MIQRALESQVVNRLHQNKVLVITGARQVGKTTMLKNIFNRTDFSVLWLNADEDRVRTLLSELNVPSLQLVIGKYKYVVIDEIQRIENAGLLLKILHDNFPEVQFIATSSSALDISASLFEPLTGRHFLFHLHPFGLHELYRDSSPFEVEGELPFHLIYGNYPDICNNRSDAKFLLQHLAGQYLYKDVLAWKDIRKPQILDKLLKLLAYQTGSEVSLHELAKQLKVSSETIDLYIDLLEKSFVVFRLKSISRNPRKEVSKMSKIFFWDNGIRNAVIDNFDDMELRQDTGALWENFMIAERLKSIVSQNSTPKSYFWRNYNQSEVDYVEEINGELSAFEMKWNTLTKQKVTKAFTNDYPDAETQVITPRNFFKFTGLTES